MSYSDFFLQNLSGAKYLQVTPIIEEKHSNFIANICLFIAYESSEKALIIIIIILIVSIGGERPKEYKVKMFHPRMR
jgi:hypothetical protein